MVRIWSDIGHAFRSICRNKLLSAFTLTVAIVSAIFLNVVLQLTDIVYGNNPPFINADRTVSFLSSDFMDKEGRYVEGIKARYIRGFKKKLSLAENLCVSNSESVMILAGDNVIPTQANFVSGQYWNMNAFDFVEGRGFTEDEASDAAKVSVITEGLARRCFGKSSYTGRKIEIQGIEYEIIGVVADYSSFAISGERPDVWLTNANTKFLPSGDPYYTIDIQFREGVPKAEFKQDLYTALKGFYRDRNIDIDLELEDIKTVKESRMAVFGDGGGVFIGLGVIILLLLLIPVVNIVSLNESGIQGRISELAVRRAVGATRVDIVRLIMTENLLVVMTGVIIGLAITHPVVGVVEKLFFGGGGADATILAGPVPMINILFIFIYAILFSTLSTGIPVWLSTRECIASVMKGGGHD